MYAFPLTPPPNSEQGNVLYWLKILKWSNVYGGPIDWPRTSARSTAAMFLNAYCAYKTIASKQNRTLSLPNRQHIAQAYGSQQLILWPAEQGKQIVRHTYGTTHMQHEISQPRIMKQKRITSCCCSTNTLRSTGRHVRLWPQRGTKVNRSYHHGDIPIRPKLQVIWFWEKFSNLVVRWNPGTNLSLRLFWVVTRRWRQKWHFHTYPLN